MAHNIDLTVLLPLYYLLGLLISDNGWLMAGSGLLTFCYEAGFVASRWQGTPGKHYMKLLVIDENGEPLTVLKSLFRSLAKAVSMATLFIGFVALGLHPRRKSLHDRICHTYVIFRPAL